MSGPDERVTEVLRKAEEAVDQAGTARDLRPAAFEAAVRMLIGGASSEAYAPARHAENDSSTDAASGLAAIALKVGVDVSALSYVYEEDGDGLRLVIRRDMLPNPNSRAAAMRDVAQLVMVGRQDAEFADWTPYDVIRTECMELGVLDGPNFASEIQSLDVRLQGGKRSREARLTRHGLDQAEALLRRMVGGRGSSPASG